MAEKKYELTDETILTYTYRILHRIRALRDFGNVKKGDLGGFIEKEENLSHEGDAWVYGNAHVYADARVYGNAHVYGDARVYDNARVYGDASVFGIAHIYYNMRISDNSNIKSSNDICYIVSFGSRDDNSTFFRCKDNSIRVNCGCFKGTLDEFREKVIKTHGNNQYAKEYLLAADLAELRLNRPHN